MTHARGTVVVASDPFGETPRRPYLVVSDETHPFAGEQYLALGITTKEYEESVPLAGSYVRGALTRDSFISPWATVSLLSGHIDRAVARVADTVVDVAARRMAEFAGVEAVVD